MRSEQERLMAALAHGLIILSYGTGVGGPIAAFVIWMVNKDKSKWVAFQALQAIVYQIALLCIGIVFGAVMFATFFLWILWVPVFSLLGLAFLVYAGYGAYQCWQGKDFKYIYVGDFVAAKFGSME
ncbi:MAG: DUF4870 domain-containing protein [Firmicutes bacterium]|nr:DUF4870 domain-containing protein [Bacillota bacterium]